MGDWYVPEPNTGCWLWMRGADSRGYGVINRRGLETYAHRVAYTFLVGPIPQGLELDHLCRTPICVNPSHLEPVTHLENMRRGSIATRTHCKRGHPLFGDNLALYPGKTPSKRCCRTCQAMHRRAWELRQVAGA